MREKVEILKAISELNRIRILMMLIQKSLCVCEITSVLKLSNATVSKHLSFLRKSGFIEDEKDGKWINYCINRKSNNPIVKNIIEFLPKWFGNEEIIQKDMNIVKKADRYKITCNRK